MSGKLELSVALFTLIMCFVFVFLNPAVLENNVETFVEGEAIYPVNGTFDFKTFTLENSTAKNFTAKYVGSGHTLLVDETGDVCINLLQFDKMASLRKSTKKSFISNELLKTNWMVDGVCVHEVEFASGYRMYSACVKDTSTDTLIYVATPDEVKTAQLVNSISLNS